MRMRSVAEADGDGDARDVQNNVLRFSSAPLALAAGGGMAFAQRILWLLA